MNSNSNGKNSNYDWFEKLINEFSKLFQSTPEKKYALNEYYDIVCDYIEKLMKKAEENKKTKCYGGKCDFSISTATEKGSVFIFSDKKDVEYINSSIVLYFKDSNGKWETLNALGKIPKEKFDMNDKETSDFIFKLKTGEMITEKIDSLD